MIFDLDANASYAPSEHLRGVISKAWDLVGNPSSLHTRGQRARAALEDARAAVRELVGASSRDHVVFTSGATEGNNTVVASAVAQRSGAIVTTAIEHPCILQPVAVAAAHGRSVVYVQPSVSGEVCAQDVVGALPPDVALVSVMAANNETGVINDIARIAALVRERAPQALLHTDAAQLLGKEKVNFAELGVDCMTISGHKCGALPGVGAIIIQHGTELAPLLLGGPQENKLRAGTENILGAVSFACAARESIESLSQRAESMRVIRDRFEALLTSTVPEFRIHGRNAPRLPNTSSVAFAGIRGDDLVVALDLAGVLVSSGAACSSGKPDPSHVLAAMGLPEDVVRSTVRFSFRGDYDVALADRIVNIVAGAVERMRPASALRGV
jgi:cysteine desulfurase